jgi:hypothetical protein
VTDAYASLLASLEQGDALLISHVRLCAEMLAQAPRFTTQDPELLALKAERGLDDREAMREFKGVVLRRLLA